MELPFLHAELFREYELRPPKGVLLYGPPGCGKTLIAKAVANSLAKKVAAVRGDNPDEGRAFFLNIKGPELLNKFVGETERHIRLIFQRAREKASAGTPVIVFFDEMDSIFRTRGSGVSSDVETTIVPQLLAEIDGVEGLENVIVIGASNREDMIDPAILRPGRLDVKIKIERPDAEAAQDIFSKYLTSTLPIHTDDIAEFGGNRKACIDAMIQRVVERMYDETEENRFLEVTYANGDKETLYFKDFNSGAMIQNIVDRSKKSAIKSVLETGQPGLRVQHLLDAIVDEFAENEDLPNTTNPDDWARISGKKGERIEHVGDQLVVRARQDREADHVDALVDRRPRDLRRRQPDPLVDDLHAGVAHEPRRSARPRWSARRAPACRRGSSGRTRAARPPARPRRAAPRPPRSTAGPPPRRRRSARGRSRRRRAGTAPLAPSSTPARAAAIVAGIAFLGGRRRHARQLLQLAPRTAASSRAPRHSPSAATCSPSTAGSTTRMNPPSSVSGDDSVST